LLAHASLKDVHEQKILIYRGVGGRTILREKLEARGARISYCELYERNIPKDLELNLRSAQLNFDDVIPLFSGEAFENFHFALTKLNAGNTLKEIKLVVPSMRVKELAIKVGYKNVICATSAHEDAMLEVLQTLASQS
jgi:uroporphyrinogen-III synthase